MVDFLEKIMMRMVEILDKLEDLPKECPEILDSPTFQQIAKDTAKLADDMDKQTEEINEGVDLAEGHKKLD